MGKSVEKKVGYFVLILCLIGVLFINNTNAAVQNNCSDFSTPILFNYSLELRNSSSQGILIDYASCNISTSPAFINNSPMVNTNDGSYHCPIITSFPTGKYSTNISCAQGGNFTMNMRGNFEVVPDDVPLSIIIFMVGISFLFLFYAITLPSDHNAIRTLLFLTTFLIYFVIFVLVWTIISEEGASSSLVNISQNIFIAYSIIFTFIVLYIVIMIGLNIVAIFKNKKHDDLELL